MGDEFDISQDAIQEAGGSHDTQSIHLDLWRLLTPPTYSEYALLLKQYWLLIDVLPSWTDLPHADCYQTIQWIRTTLINAHPELITNPIESSHLQKTFWVWSTLHKMESYPESATTGLTAIMLILAARGRHDLAKRLASAIRGRSRLRNRTQKERRNDYTPPRLAGILDTIPLAYSPSAQCAAIRERSDEIKDAHPSFAGKILGELIDAFPPPSHDPAEISTSSFALEEESNEADAPDESQEQTYSYYRDALDRTDTPSAVHREYHQQAIWSANHLQLEDHVTALTYREASTFSTWLGAETDKALASSKPQRATALLAITIVLITGRTLDRAFELLNSTQTPNSKSRLLLDQDTLILPADLPAAAYQPDSEAAARLCPVATEFALQLPPSLVDRLRKWEQRLKRSSSMSIDETDANDVLAGYRNAAGDVSLGRIRQWLSTRLMTLSRDPAIVYWICGDTHGHSLGYLHYARVPIADLAQVYAHAVWPLFEDAPPGAVSRSTTAVGSRAVPRGSYVAAQVRQLANQFSTPNRHFDQRTRIAHRHNLLMQYVTTMLTSVVGHRISSPLLDIRRGDISLSITGKDWCGIANFGDKRIDAAHMLRPVPLGTHVSKQLGLYLRHLTELHRLLQQHKAPTASKSRIFAALEGTQPLFFQLDDQLNIEIPKYDQWHKEFKSVFPHLPSNFGRHHIASLIRKRRSPKHLDSPSPDIGGGEMACLVLGHHGIIGHPFSSDSPTTILELAQTGASDIDAVYDAQGWELRGGLSRIPRRYSLKDVSSSHLGLLDWTDAHRQMDADIEAQRHSVQKRWTTRYEELAPAAKEEFLEALREVSPELVDAISSGNSAPTNEDPITLTPAQLRRVLSHPPGNALSENRRAQAMWARLKVARTLLKSAKSKKLYSGPLPAKPYNLESTEKTPLVRDIYKAHDTIVFLRAQFTTLLKNTTSSEPLQIYPLLALSCILYGSVTDESRLMGILAGCRQLQRCPTYPDTVLIELDQTPPTTWALIGLPAVLAMYMSKLAIDALPPEPTALSHAIWAMLPTDIRPAAADDTLALLLDSASLSAVIELPGIARLALGTDPATASWSIPLTRQIPLLQGDLDDRPLVAKPKQVRPSASRSPRRRTDWYRFLLETLPTDDQKTAATEEQKRRVETHRRHRKPAAACIKQAMEEETLSEIERALGRWVRQMLLVRKGRGRSLYTIETVRTYLTSIGSVLLAMIGDRPCSDIEDDEWGDLYSNVISGYSGATLNRKLRQIERFHQILRKYFSAPPLPRECLPAQADVEPFVRTSVALPTEIREAINQLGAIRMDYPHTNVSAREITQAQIALTLLEACPCRPGEIKGLQFRDIDLERTQCRIRVRPNAHRALKSKAAARVIPFRLRREDVETVRNYLNAESSRLGKTHWRPTRLIFLDLSEHAKGLPTSATVMRYWLTNSLRTNSPVDLISYDIRHTHGTRFQVEMALSIDDRPSFTAEEWFIFPRQAPDVLRLPRHCYARSMLMGHARPRTTNHSYGGMPWVYLVGPGQRQIRYIDQKAIESLCSLSTDTARYHLRKHADNIGTWALNRFDPSEQQSSRRKPPEPSPRLEFDSQPDVPPAIKYLVVAHAEGHEDAYAAYGLTDVQYHLLRDSAAEIFSETGFALLPSVIPTNKPRRRTELPPRRYANARPLVRLTEQMIDPNASIWKIAASYRQIKTAGQPQEDLIFSHSTAADLQQAISELDPRFVISVEAQGTKAKVTIRTEGRSLNRQLAWILLAVEAVRALHQSSDSSSGGTTSSPSPEQS